ncbi:Phosphorelay protein [Thalictrum thalictroides]|uniref:Phosphorelay protein n=1 Tax=Thalictrum thalictroides TaxID=46969 RepID=A0A7J6VAW7_THATH|nr:Phosphorelay protein [Thalictrum thalictroides]
MDTKSLAKSKRAHSQHHSKKFHPNPKSKSQITTTPSDSNAKKPSGKQIPEKSRKPQSSSSALPSNWDRYEEELDTNLQAVSNDGIIKDSDVVLPKSKGADFAYLITEAQSQLESQQTSSSVLNEGSFASFYDDNLLIPGFTQGISSMLSVRGNGILSWIGNDNFIVDDISATKNEASFLSMDLHSLASKIEKIDRSRRLFIEADILPTEEDVDRSKETMKPESELSENHASGAAEQCSSKSAFLEPSDAETSFDQSSVPLPSTVTRYYSSLSDPRQRALPVDQGMETVSSTTNGSGSAVQSISCEGTRLVNPTKDDYRRIERGILGEVVESLAQFNVNDVEDSSKEKTSAFEAVAAEAELDMLLNSFGETKLLDMSKKPGSNLPIAQSMLMGDELAYSSKLPSKESSTLTKSVLLNVDIDDTLDDLLRETYNTKDQNNPVPPEKAIVLPCVPSSSLNPAVVLDDFDSWLDTI